MTTIFGSRCRLFALVLACMAGPVPILVAQQDPSDDAPLTRREFKKFLEEYQKFRGEYVKLKQENEELRRQVAKLKPGATGAPVGDWQAQLDALSAKQRDSILEDVREELRYATEPLRRGTSDFAFSGSAEVTYHDAENGNTSFDTKVKPFLLWQPTDRLLLESEVEFELEDNETAVGLETAQISYLLNDYVTLAGGKFLMPFGTFWERWHPSWINKMVTRPLVYDRKLIGEQALGVQARGGFPIGKTKLNYAAYFANGPEFQDSGMLSFKNYSDSNNNKTIGGRVGFLPVPELELGYSFQTGRVGASGSEFDGIDTVIQGIDLGYSKEIEAIGGRLDLRAASVWSNTDDAVLDGVTFKNNRNGWFVQAAYRPTLSNVKLGDSIALKNLEFVVRYDQLSEPGPGSRGADTDEISLGLDYWIRPSVVWKLTYQHDTVAGADDEDALFAQFVVAF